MKCFEISKVVNFSQTMFVFVNNLYRQNVCALVGTNCATVNNSLVQDGYEAQYSWTSFELINTYCYVDYMFAIKNEAS